MNPANPRPDPAACRSHPCSSRCCANGSTRTYSHRQSGCCSAPATTWLRAGMPLAETTRRLGHSVDTLVSTYVGALDDEEHIGNQRIDSILG